MFDKKTWQALHEAIRQDNAGQVKSLAGKLPFRGDKYYEACLAAIKADAGAALDALLTAGGGFGFYTSGGTPNWNKSYNIQHGQHLVKTALGSPAPAPLLLVLEKANRATPSAWQLSPEDFLTKEAPDEVIRSFLNKDAGLFDLCVRNIDLYPAEKLESILAFAARSPNPGPALNEALAKAAAAGDMKKARMLLAHYADPNANGGLALLRAGEGGHQDMVDLLLPLVRPDFYKDFAIQLKQREAPAAVIAAIEAGATSSRAAADGYKPVDADTLENIQTLSDGSTLKTIFNLLLEQQITILATKDGVSPPAVTKITKAVKDNLRAKLDELNKKPVAAPRPQIMPLSA